MQWVYSILRSTSSLPKLLGRPTKFYGTAIATLGGAQSASSSQEPPSTPISATDHPEPGKPCVPFTLVFLLKPQALVQHRDFEELWFRLKASTDALDLRMTFFIACGKGVGIRCSEAHLPPPFVASAAPRGRGSCGNVRISCVRAWRALGFSVQVPIARRSSPGVLVIYRAHLTRSGRSVNK